MKRASSVEDYVRQSKTWNAEILKLCGILRSTQLQETIKWGAPCYTYRGKNVVSVGAFKAWFGLWFHQGALLEDKNGVLVNAQEGVTKALRQWRMTGASDIRPALIKRYVNESIAHADAGREIRPDRNKLVKLPDELRKAMRHYKGATAAWRELGKGKQREFANYISSAVRDETKKKRIEKVLPMIVAGTGLSDRYR